VAKTTRIYGPYPDGVKWRVVLLNDTGNRVARMLPSREDAEAFVRELEQEVQTSYSPRTVAEAFTEYLEEKQASGLKENSVRTIRDKLLTFFPPDERLALSRERAAELYRTATTRMSRYQRTVTAATHRAQLRCARAFYSWCVDRGYLAENPFSRVKGTGRVNTGKVQLRLDEVRKLVEVLISESQSGDKCATALLLQLLLGLRSSEILTRQVRDVDDGGRVLWIPDGKTKNARRRLSVPVEVQPLVKVLTEGRAAAELLFGEDRSRPYTSPVLWKRLRRLCQKAGVREVCPHSLRGLHSTLAIEAGSTSGAVIAQLGHSSFRTTERHYVDKDRYRDASVRRVTDALASRRDEVLGELEGLTAEEVRELVAAVRARRTSV
jgi:integrase